MGETSTIATTMRLAAAGRARTEQAALALPARLLENDLFIEQFFTRHEPELTQRHADGLMA
jgi:antitoxin CptB